jgi:hypothetical protein
MQPTDGIDYRDPYGLPRSNQTARSDRDAPVRVVVVSDREVIGEELPGSDPWQGIPR